MGADADYDIVIAGAGPVGSVLALLLAQRAPRPERILLQGRQLALPQSQDDAVANADPRSLALNHGSRSLLEQLGGWPARHADIATVHVSQQGRLGRTLISHQEFGVPRLGSVVGYDTLLTALHAQVKHCGVTCSEGQAGPGEPPQGRPPAALRPGGVLVQSDGVRPQGLTRAYHQHAVLAVVRASRPRPGWAYERFTRQGPLALLPHPAGNDCYSVVWCCTPTKAQMLRQLDDTAYAAALAQAVGDRLGRLASLGPRHVVPLSLHAGPLLINPHTVAIGNAAQTLHPVAGQGLNLGLRDAAQLATALAPWLDTPDTDPAPVLAGYAAQRRPDRWITMGLTDLLPRVFATGNPLIEHAGGLSLLALDLSATLRAPLARQLLQGLRT